MSRFPRASARSRWLPPVVAVAAVVAVVVVAYVVAGGNGPTGPPVLRLVGVAGGSLGLPPQSAADAAGKGGAPGSRASGSGWRLAGTLPDGPSRGRVHLLPAGALTRTFVSELARALGMSGEPKHLTGGWYLNSGTTELSVSELAGRHWTYANHGCIAGPVLDPQTGAACAIAMAAPPVAVKPDGSGVTRPPTARPSVSEHVARGVAGPVLEAVGIKPDAARVETAGGERSVVFSPEVGGSTVLGLETRVSVDEHGQIVDAVGQLATPTAGATYPLISARRAYDLLREQPQPMMELGLPCRIVPGKAGCATMPDRVVTGATLGLTQAYSTDGSSLLVPAWLFELRGEPTPIPVVAVERAFLGEPKQTFPGAEPSSPASSPATKPTR